MLETSARLLRLLSLLQTQRDWTGPDLADRLNVTTRTVRNDVERLRELGYPVHATPGRAGGYRLGAGAALPPLLLDDEEAVAVAIGLRTARGVSGIAETSARALAKLEQVLPSRLRHRVSAMQSVTVPVTGAPTVDASVLTAIVAACRAREQLRFDYRDHGGAATLRRVEPYRLVHARGRWYLVAWDVDRGDWRTFRADRITPRVPTGPRFSPRELPSPDLAAYVSEGLVAATWRFRADVLVHAPAAEVAAAVPQGAVQAVDETSCVLSVGSDTPGLLALYLGMLDADFTVTGPPELVARLRALADRFTRAVGADGQR
ncbi:putative DNA-binding transcriptional regulator YafY [Saccharothrix tamanrassetensis]|uniref:Putative DNA-binding transcriptional regulator YafY n=1 Tax=Saccharothrix tamanrassetensis TaxID=1051531 RepID=A0A841C4N8_9PSEU|nr:transcriptional regulator [Saccharothrix tamanrassetensis]MBB5953492.1 putative DNA-binding transcriptional regulator YafY [Saccharothrix tamanrassetensis]